MSKAWWNCNKYGHRYKDLIVMDDPRVYAHCCSKCTYNLAYQLVIKKNGIVVRKRVKLINPPLATLKYRKRMKMKRRAKMNAMCVVAKGTGTLTQDNGGEEGLSGNEVNGEGLTMCNGESGRGLTRQPSIDSAIPHDPGQRIFDSGSKSGPES